MSNAKPTNKLKQTRARILQKPLNTIEFVTAVEAYCCSSNVGYDDGDSGSSNEQQTVVNVKHRLKDDGNIPSRREVPAVKDKRLAHQHAHTHNFEWKWIRVNDFSSFIHHNSTVNNAQIIKRNVSVSFHSISAIR